MYLQSCRFAFLFSVLALATAGLNWHLFTDFWIHPIVQGWDGTSHAAIAEHYSRHIFPATWGWIPHWFSGMPFPQFYPPLFHLLLAVLDWMTSLPFPFLVKLLISFLLLTLPALISWVTYKQLHSLYAAVIAGLAAVMALSLDYPASKYGISVSATIVDGLFTQLLGFYCLLLWAHFFLLANTAHRYFYISIGCLTLTLLANVHIVPIAVTLFFVTFFYDVIDKLSKNGGAGIPALFGRYAILGAFPVALSAFWYLPMFAYFDYLATMALPAMDFRSFLSTSTTAVAITLVAAVMSTLERNRSIQVISITCAAVIFIGLADGSGLLPDLPLQPFRFLAAFYFFSALLIGYVLAALVSWFPNTVWRLAVFAILIAPIVWITAQTSGDRHNYQRDYEVGDIMNIVDHMKDRDALVNVEVVLPGGQPSLFVFNALLGKAGINTTYTVFRESAIGSIFMTPLRNSLSQNQEAWGIDTFLARDAEFLSQSLDQHLRRAKFMGVTHLIVASSMMVERLSAHSSLRLEERFGPWHLFEIDYRPERAVLVDYEPAVFYGKATFKKRGVGDYDFVRFQEEMFFQAGFDTLIVLTRDSRLDDSEDLKRFKIAIIAEYNYANIESALAGLSDFSRENPLICIESNDPLYDRLWSLDASHKIYFVERLIDGVDDYRAVRQQIGSVLSLLDKLKVSISGDRSATVTDITQAADRITVELGSRLQAERPVLVKTNYFPQWWRSNPSKPVYLASPTFMLTYADRSFSLEFTAGKAVVIGQLISLIAALLVLWLALRHKGITPVRKNNPG